MDKRLVDFSMTMRVSPSGEDTDIMEISFDLHGISRKHADELIEGLKPLVDQGHKLANKHIG